MLTGCSYAPSDVYYTFETPRGTLTGIANNEVYENIFNIVNESDPVPKVAPQAWGFTWYGTVEWIPSLVRDGEEYANKLQKMLMRYQAIGSGQDAATAYRIDDFSEHEMTFDAAFMLEGKFPVQLTEKADSKSQDAFLNDAIDSLANGSLVSRSHYVQQYQSGIREVFSLLNMTDEQRQRFGSLFAQKIYDNYGFLLLASGAYGGLSVLEGNGDFADYLLKTPLNFIVQYAEESLNESGITDYSPAQINQLAQDLFNLIMSFITSNPGETLDLVANCVKVVDGQAVGGSIPQAHYPEICLAWIQSMDSNYVPNASTTFSQGGYRIARANGPVDILVYNEEDELIFSSEPDAPDDVSASLSSTVTTAGETLIYIPAGSEYSLELLATGDGEVSYAVNEYNPLAGGIIRIMAFPELAVSEDDVLFAALPAWEEDLREGSSSCEYSLAIATQTSAYSLSATEAEPIEAEANLTGEDALEALFEIQADSNESSLGAVMGSGMARLGDWAAVSAYPLKNASFTGWYSKGELVSHDVNYRFRVDSDTTVTAVFVDE